MFLRLGGKNGGVSEYFVCFFLVGVGNLGGVADFCLKVIDVEFLLTI